MRLTDWWRARQQDREIRRLIRESGLFDREYYLRTNPDIAILGVDPEKHYLERGYKEGRSPSAQFDPQAYLEANPDLANSGIDPVVHYLLYGRAEGRRTQTAGQMIAGSGLFDAEFYRTLYLDVAMSGQDPLAHYLRFGIQEHRQPSLDFDPSFYLSLYPDVRRTGVYPILHYIQSGRAEKRRGRDGGLSSAELTAAMKQIRDGRLFDDTYYLLQCPALSEVRVNTLLHYLVSGFGNWVDPSPGFSTLDYQRAHPDVWNSGVNPLLHFLGVADAKSRTPMPGDAVRRERTGGSVYFARYGFAKYSDAAIRELATRKPKYLVGEREPDVSIILSDGELHQILNCLDSLSRQQSRFSAEVLVDSPMRELEAIPWLQCCAANVRELVRGRILVFLRGDTRVAESWLDELAGSFEVFPNAGCVGVSTDDSDHPRDCFAQQVDSVSNAAFAVPAERWLQENEELARRIREANYQVWVQPLARVVDYASGERIEAVSAERGVLVVDEVTPTPDRDSGSFITVRILRALHELGYQVTFVPQRSYAYDPIYTRDLQRRGVECVYAPHLKDIGQVLALQNESYWQFVLAFRFDVTHEIYSELRQKLPETPLIFHNVDLHFLREEREAALKDDARLRAKAAVTKALELDLMTKVDCTIVHTKVESDIIKQHLGIENIIEFPYVAEVHRSAVAFEDRHDIVFLGNFKHPPNADAVKYFATSVWPVIERSIPDEAKFVIAGPSAPDEIQQLAGPRISLTGHVAELREVFERARVFVAPLRYGAGIKGKVIQSLCYGAPSVVTPVAAEGIGLRSDQETIIATDDFAEQVVRLYFDEELWLHLQANGYAFVENHFSWNRCLELCAEALEIAAATRTARQVSYSGGDLG